MSSILQEGVQPVSKIITKVRQLRMQKQLRENRDVPIQEVAMAIGITHAALSNIENRKTERMHFETLRRLCDYYGVGVGDVLEYDPNKRAIDLVSAVPALP